MGEGGMEQTGGTPGSDDGPAFVGLAVLFLTLLSISLFLFGVAFTVPPM